MLGTELNASWVTDAEVLETADDGKEVRLRHENLPGAGEAWARVAVPTRSPIAPGATVLAAGGQGDKFYVIGVLEDGRRVTAGPRHDGAPDGGALREAGRSRPGELTLPGGARVEITGEPGAETLQVISPENELIFQYDDRSGKARVVLGKGDVEVAAGGSIDFVSPDAIRFHGASVGITGTTGVEVRVEDALGRSGAAGTPGAALRLGPKEVRLDGPNLAVDARKGVIRIGDARLSGKRLSAELGTARISAGRLETTARTVVQKAKDVFRTVEGLVQTRAGRLRTLVASTLQMKSKRAYLKADDDFKVNADKIHLG